jgi:glycosyltransferase involved in cell wall biosynthesis
MRIIVGTPNWTLNGVNTFSAGLVRGLQDQGIEATLLITGSIWRDRKPLPWPSDLPVRRLPLPLVATFSARWRALRRFLEVRKPCIYLPNHDVLHSAVTPVLSSAIGVIGIAHSDDPQHYEHVRRLGPWCNAVVGVSVAISKRLRTMSELNGIPTFYIPYGVGTSDEPAAEQQDGTSSVPGAENDNHTFSILYAGRLEQAQKRVGDLAHILHAVHQRGVPARLTVAGEGSARGALRKALDARGLGGHVRWLGTVAPSSMARLYRSHPVLLLPSAYEGLPLAVIEAMIHGCIPVVSAITSGIPDLIENGVNGFCVSIGDYDGFADRIAALAGNAGQREIMAAAARATITGDYTLKAMIQRYTTMFHETWKELIDGRYQRPAGVLRAADEFTWRQQLRAPFAGWQQRLTFLTR